MKQRISRILAKKLKSHFIFLFLILFSYTSALFIYRQNQSPSFIVSQPLKKWVFKNPGQIYHPKINISVFILFTSYHSETKI